MFELLQLRLLLALLQLRWLLILLQLGLLMLQLRLLLLLILLQLGLLLLLMLQLTLHLRLLLLQLGLLMLQLGLLVLLQLLGRVWVWLPDNNHVDSHGEQGTQQALLGQQCQQENPTSGIELPPGLSCRQQQPRDLKTLCPSTLRVLRFVVHLPSHGLPEVLGELCAYAGS